MLKEFEITKEDYNALEQMSEILDKSIDEVLNIGLLFLAEDMAKEIDLIEEIVDMETKIENSENNS